MHNFFDVNDEEASKQLTDGQILELMIALSHISKHTNNYSLSRRYSEQVSSYVDKLGRDICRDGPELMSHDALSTFVSVAVLGEVYHTLMHGDRRGAVHYMLQGVDRFDVPVVHDIGARMMHIYMDMRWLNPDVHFSKLRMNPDIVGIATEIRATNDYVTLMPILRDALEDNGGDDAILQHIDNSLHSRGCSVIEHLRKPVAW